MRERLLPPNYQDNATWSALAEAIDLVFSDMIDNPELLYPVLRDTFNFFPPLLNNNNIVYSMRLQYAGNTLPSNYNVSGLIGSVVIGNQSNAYTTIVNARNPTGTGYLYLDVISIQGTFIEGEPISVITASTTSTIIKPTTLASFGIRRTVNSYTGPLLQIVSGTTHIDIPQDANGNLSVAALAPYRIAIPSTTPTLYGSQISKIYDQSGNGNNLNPVGTVYLIEGGMLPVVGGAYGNGKNYYISGSTNGYFDLTSNLTMNLANFSANFVMTTANTLATTGNSTVWGFGQYQTLSAFGLTNGYASITIADTGDPYTTTATNNLIYRPAVVTAVVTNSNIVLYSDGVAGTSVQGNAFLPETGGVNPSISIPVVFSDIGTSNSSFYEFNIYDHSLSPTDRAILEQNQLAYYNAFQKTPQLTDNLIDAFSLRRVVPSYTGPLICVQFIGTSTQVDIPQDANGNLDASVLLPLLNASNEVYLARWYNQVTTSPLTYLSSFFMYGTIGYSVVTVGGSLNYGSTNNFCIKSVYSPVYAPLNGGSILAAPNRMTVNAVSVITGSGNVSLIQGASNTLNNFGYVNGYANYNVYNAYNAVQPNDYNTTNTAVLNPKIITATVFDASKITVYADGVASTPTIIPIFTGTGTNLTELTSQTSFTNSFTITELDSTVSNSEFYEFLYYSTYLSDQARMVVEGNQASFFGITLQGPTYIPSTSLPSPFTLTSEVLKAAQLGWGFGNTYNATVPLNEALASGNAIQDMYSTLGTGSEVAVYDSSNFMNFYSEEYVKVNRQLGFFLQNTNFSNESFQMIMSCIGEQYAETGTPSFVDFFSYVLSSFFDIELMWSKANPSGTMDVLSMMTESNFLSKNSNSPSTYPTVWQDSVNGWYPTSRVQITSSSGKYSQFTSNLALVNRFFKYVAPLNLIMTAIAVENYISTAETYSMFGGAYLSKIIFGKLGTLVSQVIGSLPANFYTEAAIQLTTESTALNLTTEATSTVLVVLPGMAPSHVFSLRKIVSTYTGYCVDIVRASDSVLMSIGFDTNGNFDVATYNTFIGTGVGLVSHWYNQAAPNGNGVGETSNSYFPVMVLSGSLNKPCLSANGSNLLWAASGFQTITQQSGGAAVGSWTSSAVAKRLGGTSAMGEVFMQSSVAYFAAFNSSNQFEAVAVNSAGTQFTATNTTANPIVVSAMCDAAGGVLNTWVNGTIGTSVPITGSMASGTGDVGLANDQPSSGNWFQGEIYEIIIYPAALSTSDLSNLENNQGGYYGVAIA